MGTRCCYDLRLNQHHAAKQLPRCSKLGCRTCRRRYPKMIHAQRERLDPKNCVTTNFVTGAGKQSSLTYT